MGSTIDVGERAPDFELPGTVDAKVTLSAQLGSTPVLLLFYPLDWSPVCTEELCSLKNDFDDYAELGIKVFAISVDSIFSHKAFAAQHGIQIPLLSDFNKTVCKAYGAFHEEILGLQGIAKRAVFLIDAKGIVRYRWVSDDPGQLPDLKAVAAQVEALK